MDDVTGGEHVYIGYDLPLHARLPDGLQLPGLGVGDGGDPPLPPHVWVPTSGSSLHFPLMQMSWPAQSLSVLHGPLQLEIAVEYGRGREIKVKMRERDANKEFAIQFKKRFGTLRSTGG